MSVEFVERERESCLLLCMCYLFVLFICIICLCFCVYFCVTVLRLALFVSVGRWADALTDTPVYLFCTYFM